MYAIIKSGGKQYRVAVGDIIDVELLEGELGEAVTFNEVLLIANEKKTLVGNPTVENGVVKGLLVDYVGGPKIQSMKYRKRKRSYRKWGHRQLYARIKIEGIEAEQQQAEKAAKEESQHGS